MKLFGLNPILQEVEGSTTSISDDVNFLNAEEPIVEQEPSEEEVAEVEEPEEDQEEPLTEEQEEEQEEEKPEIKDIHPFDRPSLKQIEEKYPGFFKQFPAMRDVYFREAEYSKLFPTIDDAKEAGENNEAFNNIREDVFEGSGNKFFTAIKEVNEKSLEKFAGRVLSSLFTVHRPAFWRAANPLVEDICRNMFQKGVKEKNENLQNSARYLADYFFGDNGSEIAEGKRTSIVKDEGSDEVKREREEFDNEKGTAFRTLVSTTIRAQLRGAIDSKTSEGKSRLDPDGVLSDFIKNTIIAKIVDDIGSELQADQTHLRFMDSLFGKAKRNGRTEEDKARIVSAYLARAKSIIPSLRSKYVSEALGRRSGAATRNKEKVEKIQSRREAGGSGHSSREGRKNYDPKAIDYSKTSDEDLLNDNITYRK